MKKNPYEMLQAHVKSGTMITADIREPAAHLVCEDGFSMSVQASRTHYCSPRDNDGPYVEFEVWCMSAPTPEFAEYQYEDDPAAYVPLDVVLAVIRKHGGIKEGSITP